MADGEDTNDDTDDDVAMKGALENILHHPDDINNHRISQAMIRGLLMGEPVIDEIEETCASDHLGDDDVSTRSSNSALCHKLRGLPHRPLYKEISRRLHIMQQHYSCRENRCQEEDREEDASSLSCFLPASHFGLTEIHNLNELIPPPPPLSQPLTIDTCKEWIQTAGDPGIDAILGCRRTIGTINNNLLPPTTQQLITASRNLYKPSTQSSLTVAARALAKHAHRGSDQFFGILTGSESQKNEHADRVIQRLMREAMWMNIHCFGGVDESNPIMEIRTFKGYGARWSGRWQHSDEDDVFEPVEDVEFRGFLEPQVCIIYLYS